MRGGLAASAPLRADLAGGTVDLWPLYLLHPGACTVNVALGVRARVRYRPGGDRWRLASRDRGERLSIGGHEVEEAARRAGTGSPFALLLTALAHLGPVPPGELVTRVEGPPGGGLAGSSALLIACCGLFARAAGRRLRRGRLPEMARDLEAMVLGLPTGVQDYYPALYGGVQRLDYGPGQPGRRAVGVSIEELQARLVLAYSGVAHESAAANWAAYRRRLEGEPRSRRAFQGVVDAAAEAGAALEAGDWSRLAAAMDADWRARRRLHPGVASAALRRLERAARRAGALAAKACGAAGGGCMLFLVDPQGRRVVEEALGRAGGSLVDCRVSRGGLRVWRTDG